MARPKLQDVAHKVGVSLATASLALSGKGRISPQVRERVLAAAGEIGYTSRSGPRAGGARGGTAVAIIHLLDRDYEWGFVRPMLFELAQAMHQKGHAPIMIPVSAKSSVDHVVQLVEAYGCSAAFSVHFSNERVFAELERRGIFLVAVNNSNFQDKFYSVCVDDFQGAYESALFLVGLGHRSIAFVEYERPDMPMVLADRFVGFRKALEEHRLPFAPECRITIPLMDAKRLTRKLAALFSRPGRPTAIFAHDDYLGLYVISSLKELGLRVPEDVSLIAPGDVLDYSYPLMPQITTMRINTSLLGRIAADLMLDRIKSNHEDVHVLKVKQQLVKRASCIPL